MDSLQDTFSVHDETFEGNNTAGNTQDMNMVIIFGGSTFTSISPNSKPSRGAQFYG